MRSHVVDSVADLAKGLVTDRAGQTLAATPGIAVLRVSLGQDCHDLFKLFISGPNCSSVIYKF